MIEEWHPKLEDHFPYEILEGLYWYPKLEEGLKTWPGNPLDERLLHLTPHFSDDPWIVRVLEDYAKNPQEQGLRAIIRGESKRLLEPHYATWPPNVRGLVAADCAESAQILAAHLVKCLREEGTYGIEALKAGEDYQLVDLLEDQYWCPILVKCLREEQT